METRHKPQSFPFLAPKERQLSTGGARGRSVGSIGAKKRKRSVAIRNLSYAHAKLKKIKKNSHSPKILKHQAPDGESGSQKIQILLKKSVQSIDWESKRIFAVHSYYFLKNLGLENCFKKAADLNGVCESFVRNWKAAFKAKGEIATYTKWGHNSKYVSIFDYEDKMLEAKKWIRQNTNKRGEKPMTIEKFSKYCTDLMSDVVVKNEKNTSISLETCRRWLHKLGFEYSSMNSGYNDGHDKQEVKEYRQKYLASILEYQNQGYLFDDKGKRIDIYKDISFKKDYPHGGQLQAGVDQPVIIVYHDESIYNVNDEKRFFWQDNETPSMKPKGKGLGVMISDFITEDGFLDNAQEMKLRVCLEYNSEGHWNHDRMKDQVTLAIKVFEKRYPEHQAVFVFDNALTHVAYEKGSLIAKYLNVKDGGNQPILRDTVWNGEIQRLTVEDGNPKGLRTILQERGLFKNSMNREEMIKVLSKCEDFLAEKPSIQKLIESSGHHFLLLPKFHCELNPIERCWAFSKKYVRERSTNKFAS